MDPEKEKMLAYLDDHSTTLVPSFYRGEGLPYTYLGSVPNTSSHTKLQTHSCPSSSLNVHSSCITSTNSVNIPPQCSSTPLSCHEISGLPPEKMAWLSDSDMGGDSYNTCRICQVPGDSDYLVSPCRCSGSLKYVHYSCLLKWIEYSSRKTKKPPMCELCHFVYVRHKKFRFQKWQLPRVSSRDKFLHTVFLLTLVLMVSCAVATVLCFLSDNGQVAETKSQLTTEEVITLTCGVLFFISFFAAMTVEIKARHTVYRLFRKFITRNTEWKIEPYDKAKDILNKYPI
ncbi:unnamed protein product [Lymnaea stagnalis]|uniref:RING-CH-type domain-containing protein n=1 Tax=Lymnaea stagnalis TaxID=6523 RepID=A0AAV2HY91_LYMST